MKKLESQDVAEFDYIIVGGIFAYPPRSKKSGQVC